MLSKARWLIFVGAVLGLALWILVARLLTPTHLTLLTGPEGSTSHQDALRYRPLLEARGVSADVEVTDGSAENLVRLASEGGVTVTFAEVALERALERSELADQLSSLGSLYVSPIWVFVRSDLRESGFGELAGRRLVVGAAGSATRVMAEHLFELNGVDDEVATEGFDELGADAARRALATGEVDAVLAIGDPGAPAIGGMLDDPAIEAMAFRRAATYERLSSSLVQLSVLEGAVDLRRNIPPSTLQMLGVPVQLVVPRGLHPALVDLLLDVATRVHREPTLFSERDRFPSPHPVSLELARAAERWYEEGPPPLWRVLPFWLSSWLGRTRFLLLTLFGILVTTLQVVPPLLTYPFSRAVGRLYARMELVERALTTGELDRSAALSELEAIDRESAALKVPRRQRAPFFELRQNLHDLRDRVAS